MGDRVGMGWMGKYVFFIPSRNMTVVTMGNTWGASLACDVNLTQVRQFPAAAPCAPCTPSALPHSQRKSPYRGYYMEFYCGLT